jgi:hypothetical protein
MSDLGNLTFQVSPPFSLEHSWHIQDLFFFLETTHTKVTWLDHDVKLFYYVLHSEIGHS